MKKTMLILVFSLILSFGGRAQENKAELLKIDQMTQEIREKGYSRVDTIRFACNTLRDFGMIRYYIQDDEIRYIEIEGSDQSHSDYQKQFYVSAGKPVYARIILQSWYFAGTPEEETGPSSTKESYYESYFYAQNGKGIHCQERSYVISSDSVGDVSPDDYAFESMHCAFFEEFVMSDFNDLLKIYAARKKKHDCLFELLDPK